MAVHKFPVNKTLAGKHRRRDRTKAKSGARIARWLAYNPIQRIPPCLFNSWVDRRADNENAKP